MRGKQIGAEIRETGSPHFQSQRPTVTVSYDIGCLFYWLLILRLMLPFVVAPWHCSSVLVLPYILWRISLNFVNFYKRKLADRVILFRGCRRFELCNRKFARKYTYIIIHKDLTIMKLHKHSVVLSPTNLSELLMGEGELEGTRLKISHVFLVCPNLFKIMDSSNQRSLPLFSLSNSWGNI